MITVHDAIEACSRYGRKLDWRCEHSSTIPDLLVVHRIGPQIGDTDVGSAQDIARVLSAIEGLGRMPYSFVVLPDGMVEQAVPLRYYTPHARKYNRCSKAVAVLGDFRSETVTPAAWDSLVELSAVLHEHYGRLRIAAHDWLPDGSADPRKACPGKGLSVSLLYEATVRRLLRGAVASLDQAAIRV